MKFLEVKNLNFRYFQQSKHLILDNASLSIEQGTITVILGSSGCGKSTLAAVCAGLYPDNGGELLSGTRTIAGHDVDSMTPTERSRYLSYTFQNPDLQFCMDTLRKELIFCLENHNYPREHMENMAEEIARRFSMESFLDRQLSTLSGGEKQKAALCCALASQPRGILLDEPFSNIDPQTSSQIIDLLKRQNQEHKTTIIAIDHHPEHWLDTADEFILLGEKGCILKRGITKENMTNFRELFQEKGIVYPGIFSSFSNALKAGKTAISLENVSIRQGEKQDILLKHLSHTFSYGQITAVISPSGAGKTTLFHTFLKQKHFDGSIKLDGKELKKIKERDLFRSIGIVFQNPSEQFTTTNVFTEITETLKIWRQELSEQERQKEAEQLLKEYSLWSYKNYSPYMLSQGQQRRLAVLSMLCGGQKILLLDEPTYGQDGRSTITIMEQLRKKVMFENLCVIFSTHDHQLANAYADTICAIKGKELVNVKS